MSTRTQDLAEKVADKTGDVADKVAETAADAAAKVAELASAAAHAAAPVVEKAAVSLGDSAEKLSRKAKKAQAKAVKAAKSKTADAKAAAKDTSTKVTADLTDGAADLSRKARTHAAKAAAVVATKAAAAAAAADKKAKEAEKAATKAAKKADKAAGKKKHPVRTVLILGAAAGVAVGAVRLLKGGGTTPPPETGTAPTYTPPPKPSQFVSDNGAADKPADAATAPVEDAAVVADVVEAELAAAPDSAEEAAQTFVDAGVGEPVDENAALVPAENPFGPGSHAPLPDGGQPEGFPVKGNDSSKLYHEPGTASYERTIAEVWFDSAESAEAAGYGRPKGSRKVESE